jgi:hypothetical protein
MQPAVAGEGARATPAARVMRQPVDTAAILLNN